MTSARLTISRLVMLKLAPEMSAPSNSTFRAFALRKFACRRFASLQWALSLLLGGKGVPHPKSLLDNRPLANFLQNALKLHGIAQAIESGQLHGVAVTASSYARASAISFYQAEESVEPWARERRLGQPMELTVNHLMASAALPLIFPAQQLGTEYFGDGGMRMLSPLSPAIHLGAEKREHQNESINFSDLCQSFLLTPDRGHIPLYLVRKSDGIDRSTIVDSR